MTFLLAVATFALADPPPSERVETSPPRIDAAGGPETAAGAQAEADPNRHTRRAHERLRLSVRVELVPNLRSYEALSRRMLEALEVMDQVKGAVRKLDRLRGSSIATSIENTLPGFRWITTGWDKLSELVHRIEEIRRLMARLDRASSELKAAAERYADAPDGERYQSLVDGYVDARKTFDAARKALKEIDDFMSDAQRSIVRTAEVVDGVARIPLVGKYAGSLGEQLRSVDAKLEILRGLLDVTHAAIRRDAKSIEGIVGTMEDARAHDAYDAASQLGQVGRPGSALAAYRDLSVRWPDTQWAHRSDRRIVELVEYVDNLEHALKAARSDIAAIEAELAKKPPVVLQPVEHTRVVPARGPAAISLSIALGAGAAVLLLSVCGLLVWLRARSRASQDLDRGEV